MLTILRISNEQNLHTGVGCNPTHTGVNALCTSTLEEFIAGPLLAFTGVGTLLAGETKVSIFDMDGIPSDDGIRVNDGMGSASSPSDPTVILHISECGTTLLTGVRP